ncbi:MAG TPA: NAD-dependent epimerase/dehydratase family protein [Anaerolineae bacterium]|nr:NAD-dependent epimerase/dehydratase family protein [Anaerolineae bacterium]
MQVFVSGGTGFIGGAVVRRLLAEGHQVRALVRPGADTRRLDGLPVERVTGDLSDEAALRQGVAGCDWVFHIAALYSFWGHSWQEFYQTNVEGTRRMLEAAWQAGVRRVVHTSSIAALGVHPDHTPATEEVASSLEDRIGPYQRSKFLAEEVAREYVQRGLPVVIVNPSTPVGEGDHKPTPSGQMIVDFLRGRMFAYLDTGLNIVDVEDVAWGHLLAAERGRIGERYLLAGENLTLKQFFDLLAEVSGRPPVRFRIPHAVALAWSYVDVTLARLNPRHTPSATPEKVRLSRRYEFFDPGKAIRELGLPQTPVRQALARAVEWYRAHGYAP